MSIKADQRSLKYAGFMGHEYAQLRTERDGTVSCVGHLNEPATLEDGHSKPGDRIYKRVRIGKRFNWAHYSTL